YATDFRLTFEAGAPALRTARRAGLAWPDATVETYLALLAGQPDTHIARKLGREEAERVSARAAEVRRAGGVRTAAGREQIARLDRELRDATNSRNPGTTADLTCAALFVVILEYGWHS
ncbi:MAG TPA: triphosphoribosyl-dephospho-CoA synthase, partial [Gemmatimonadales bacterium]|nr:triphosphoribosyl-dephospho-CoA synthase [Gemmatimonadales bacterium]